MSIFEFEKREADFSYVEGDATQRAQFNSMMIEVLFAHWIANTENSEQTLNDLATMVFQLCGSKNTRLAEHTILNIESFLRLYQFSEK